MTEAEWTACNDPRPMLRQLRGKAGSRKIRLFMVATCRLGQQLLGLRLGSRAVEVAERFADGLESVAELDRAARRVCECGRRHRRSRKDAMRAWCAVQAARLACERWSELRAARSFSEGRPLSIAFRPLRGAQAGLLRCLVGNPFRPVVRDPMLRQWNGGAAVALARAMYESRDFAQSLLLADMLEDAGCTDPLILEHLRGPGRHVRGCWVIDLLLCKA